MLNQIHRLISLAAIAAFACALPVAAHHIGDAPALTAGGGGGVETTVSGTVEELVVIDKVNATTERYPILRQGDGSRVPLRGEAIQTLKTGSQVNVVGSRTGTSFTVDHVTSVAPGIKSAQVAGASVAQVDGRFTVAHHDNFETGSSQFLYQVFDARGGATEIAMPFLPGSLATGMEVNVEGTVAEDGQSIVPNQIMIQGIPPVLEASATTNYLVIPIKFPTTAAAPWAYNADPFTPAALNTAVFGNLPTKSVKEYYKEVSYGQQLLSGVVADNGAGGFLQAAVAKPATCDINYIANAAEAAAKARGYNVAAYAGILYVFNNVSGCGWSGLAYVGWARAYANNTTNLLVIAHELGHNFGLLHAGSLRCTGTPIGCGAAGAVAEYGDPFSTMGNGNAGHFNAAQKDNLGWFAPSQVKTHAGGTATYTLSPIETAGLPAYAVRIPTSNANRTYWLEYRQPVGTFDTFITGASYPNNGVQVRIEYPFEKVSGSDDTEILDMTPATGSFGDAALLVGAAPFIDPTTNLSINVVSATPGANGQVLVQVSTSAGAPSTTTLTSSNNPSNPGSSVTFTATVTGVSPTGTVNFTNGGASISGCAAATVNGSGNVRTATCATTTLAAGAHSIVANYSGGIGNTGSASPSLSQGVKSSSSTVIASSGTPSAFGASVTFTASVTGIAPTGTVSFKDGATSICAAVALAGSGNTRTATCTTSALAAGTHGMTAAYGGDAGNISSISSALSQVVNAGAVATSTALATSLTPSNAGASVTFTATVTGTAPTGIVNFKDGATSIAGCATVALVGSGNARTATCTTAALAVGTHNITAAYAGNAGNLASTSAALSQVVKAMSSNIITSSGTPSTLGASVTFTASVTGVAPTGTINFKDGAASLAGCAAVALAGSGNTRTAKCTTSALTAGTHSMTAAYSGDVGNVASTSSALSQVVKAGAVATSTALATSLTPSNAGASVTFTATVTGSAPTGTVNFKDGATSIAGCATVALLGSGNARTATCATSSLAAGTHSITAAYSGNAGNLASTSSALSQVVNAGAVATSTGIATSMTPSNSGAIVTFTATTTGTAPTGTVNFKDGATSIAGCATVALVGSGNARTATCATAALAVGTHSITAAYSGNAGNLASTSAALSQVVNSAGVGGTNVALAANGGVATASSNFVGVGYLSTAAAINNGDRSGLQWSNGGAWKDGTGGVFPDWVQINFNGQKTIDHVIVYSMQDNYGFPVDPPSTLTFTQYGVSAFQVQSWNGAAWVTLGSVTGNNLVKRQVSFTATTTDRIRVNITAGAGGYSRLTEVEAWSVVGGAGAQTSTELTSPANPSSAGSSITFTAAVTGSAPTGSVNFADNGTPIAGCTAVALAGSGNSVTGACTATNLAAGTHSITAAYSGNAGNLASTSAALAQVVSPGGGGGLSSNVALAANGGVATASSTYAAAGYGLAVAAVNNGDRAGLNWNNGGAWKDATSAAFPDWVQIDFSGPKTIDHVIVYSMQDNYASPVDPSSTLTFTQYGVTDFQVQGWNGSAWVTLGSVAGNNLVKRQVSFTATTVDRIRVNITGGKAGYSRLTEVEAWGD